MQSNLPKYILTKENSLREDPAGNITFVAQAIEFAKLHAADAKTAWAECEALQEKVASLEAALSAAEPVMYVSRNGSTCSPAFYESLVDRSRKNWQPLFAAPPALSAQAQDVAGLERLRDVTFAVQHNPNCPAKYLIRLVGKSSSIDLKPYGNPFPRVKHETGDILGFGKTIDEAIDAALAAAAAAKQEGGE